MSKLKKYISQTQCQIKSFKIQIKIFVIIISVLLLSCDYNKNKESKNGINFIDVEFESSFVLKKIFVSESFHQNVIFHKDHLHSHHMEE